MEADQDGAISTEATRKIEAQLVGLRKVSDIFGDLDEGMKTLDDQIARAAEDRASFTASLLKHSCDAGISSDDRLAQCLQKLGQVYKFICQKSEKLFGDLRQFRAAIAKVQRDLVDLKDQYEKDLKPLEQKLVAAHQKVQRIRQSKGGVNMQRLLEAEEERDGVKAQIAKSSSALTARIAEGQTRAKNCVALGHYLTVMSYSKYFQAGAQQFQSWASDAFFHSVQAEAETLPAASETPVVEPTPPAANLVPVEAPKPANSPVMGSGRQLPRVESTRGLNSQPATTSNQVNVPPLSLGSGGTRGLSADPRRLATVPSGPRLSSGPSAGSWMSGKQPTKVQQKLRFEVEKKVFQRRKNAVLTLDLEARTIKEYFPHTQKTLDETAADLLQVARCGDERQLRLVWKGRNDTEKLVFRSKEEKERFYEAAWVLRNPGTIEKTEKIKVFIGTWNLGNAEPPRDMTAWIPPKVYDIYIFGAQECEYSGRSGEPCSTEADWFGRLAAVLGEGYVTIASKSLVDMRLIILTRREHYFKISRIRIGSEATGIGNMYGNKGGIGVSFSFNETRLCFISSHLAARDERVNARNANYAAIVNNLNLGAAPMDITNYFHLVFWLGDLNYRIALPRDEVLGEITKSNWRKLFQHDQLINEQKNGRAFSGFHENVINFPPTYRYNRGDRTYSEEKMRVPSYCDRILYKHVPNFNIECIKYGCSDEVTTSDHSPVYGIYSFDTYFPNSFPEESKVAGSLITNPSFLSDQPSPRNRIASDSDECPTVSPLPSLGQSGDLRPGCTLKLTALKLTILAPPDDGGSALVGSGQGAQGWVGVPPGGRSFRGTIRSPATKTTGREKSMNACLSFSADFLEDSCPSQTHYDIGSTAVWEEHLLESFTTNREWLLKQHVWVMLKDPSNKILGQGCIPLGPSAEDVASSFFVKLTCSGILIGHLAGSLLVSRPTLQRRAEGKNQAIQETKRDTACDTKAPKAIVKQGFLIKEGGTRRSWKRRWFVATADGTVSYLTAQNGKEKGSIWLANSFASQSAGHTSKKNCFCIQGPKRTFYMCADDTADMKAWLAALQKCIDAANASTPASSSSSGSSLFSFRSEAPSVFTPSTFQISGPSNFVHTTGGPTPSNQGSAIQTSAPVPTTQSGSPRAEHRTASDSAEVSRSWAPRGSLLGSRDP